MSKRVLFVDDEIMLLESLKRQLKNRFEIEIAVGPAEGLRSLTRKGPFNVVVSDMRMPEMSGVEFLKEVQEISPTSIRIMLTGNNDQETAVQAVNSSSIFRFLTKPCSSEVLVKAVDEAFVEFNRLSAERELLQTTLSGSVRILTEMLGMVNPGLLADGVKARELMRRFAEVIGLTSSWELEIAAVIANIGLLKVGSEALTSFRAGLPIENSERQAIAKAPEQAAKLISHIPTLKEVSQIVLYHRHSFEGSGSANLSRDSLPIGARMLRIVSDYVSFVASGAPENRALARLKSSVANYDPTLLPAFLTLFQTKDALNQTSETERYEVSSSQLCVGQTLLTDIYTIDDILLIRQGNVLSDSMVRRLENYARLVGLKTPIYVNALIPAAEPELKQAVNPKGDSHESHSALR